MDTSRRRYLGSLAAVAGGSLSGCASLLGGGGGSGQPLPAFGGSASITAAQVERILTATDISDLDEADRDPSLAFTQHEGMVWYDFDAGVWTVPPTVLTALRSGAQEGELGWDKGRKLPAWDDGGNVEYPSFVDNGDVLTKEVTVADDATKTSVYTADIDAGALVEGRVLMIELGGDFTTSNNSDQFTVTMDIGGTQVMSVQNVPANETGAPWFLEARVVVYSTGLGGKMHVNSTGQFAEQPRQFNSGETGIDTTAATTVEVFIEWGVAAADNIVNLNLAHPHQHA